MNMYFELLQSSDGGRSLPDIKPKIAADESVEKSRNWKLTEISEPSQCRSLRLPDNLAAMRVCLSFRFDDLMAFTIHGLVKFSHVMRM